MATYHVRLKTGLGISEPYTRRGYKFWTTTTVVIPSATMEAAVLDDANLDVRFVDDAGVEHPVDTIRRVPAGDLPVEPEHAAVDDGPDITVEQSPGVGPFLAGSSPSFKGGGAVNAAPSTGGMKDKPAPAAAKTSSRKGKRK